MSSNEPLADGLAISLPEMAILERITEAVLLIDRQALIRYANPAAAGVLGVAVQQLLQQSISAMLPDCSQEQWSRYWHQLDQDEQIQLAFADTDDNAKGLLLRLQRLPLAERDYALGFILGKQTAPDYCSDNSGACLVADTCSTMVAYINAEQRFGYCNPAFLQWLAMSQQDCKERTLEELLSADVYEKIHPLIARCLQGEVITHEFTFKSEGRHQLLQFHLKPYTKPDQTVGCYLFIHDASEQLQLQQSLTQKQAEWTTAMEVFDDGICLNNMDDRVLQANQAFYRLTGLTPLQTIGHDINKIMHPDGEKVTCPVCRARQEHRDLDLVMEADYPYNQTGRPLLVMVRMVRDKQGGVVGILTFLRDLSQQRETEMELRNYSDHLGELVVRRTAVLSGIFRSSPVGIGLMKNRVFKEVNDQFCKMVGYSRDELLGQNARMIYPGDQEYEYVGREKYRQMAENGIGTVEVKMKSKQGKVFDVLLSSTYLDADQPEEGVVFNILDISKRKRAESTIKESERKYRMLVTQANDAIFLADVKTGKILEANQAAVDLTGRPVTELINLHQSQLHPEGEAEKYRQLFMEHAGVSKGHANEAHIKHADGRSIPVSIRTNTFTISGRQIIQGIFHDLTDLHQAEQLRMQQEKKQRDLLVREVHHRIKNNLQAVVSLLRQHMTKNPAIDAVFSKAIAQVESISLVHGLQATGSDNGVSLTSMLHAIISTQDDQACIKLTSSLPSGAPVRLDNEKSVVVSLIINELVLNAVKHRQAGSDIEINMRLSGDSEVSIEVLNTGHLPKAFDWQGKTRLGTGLDLISMLASGKSAGLELDVAQQHEQVISRVFLRPPLLF